jgi:hypothetical protein
MKPHITIHIDPMPPRNGILIEHYHFGKGVSGKQGVSECHCCGSRTNDQIVACKLSCIHVDSNVLFCDVLWYL